MHITMQFILMLDAVAGQIQDFMRGGLNTEVYL